MFVSYKTRYYAGIVSSTWSSPTCEIVYRGAGDSERKHYGYQFPTAMKARRAKIDAEARVIRVYELSKQKAYVASALF